MFICVVLMLFAVPVLAGDASIEAFSPRGDVKNILQVSVRFSEQMVSFGTPELSNPFDIACPVPGKGRWIDGKNWVYDFEKDLKAGIQCRFTLKTNVKTLQGKEIKGLKTFAFSTGGPAVKEIYPNEGSEGIEEDQVFVLKLDGNATEESITRNVSCFIGEMGERIGIRILKGAEREMVLKGLNRHETPGKTEGTVILQCKRVFPSNTEVQLVWGKGVASATGIGTTKDQTFLFKTRSPFTAKFQCHRERPNADCVPIMPVSLVFSSPVSNKLARQCTLKGDNKTYTPRFEQEGGDFVTSIRFVGPFPEKTTLSLAVPRILKDDGGRTLSNKGIFPLAVKTGPYPPLAKFSSRFGIIEKVDPVLPVTVRRVGPVVQGKALEVGKGAEASGNVSGKMRQVSDDNEMITWLRRVATIGRSRSLFEKNANAKTFSVPGPRENRAAEVIGIPLKTPGLHIVELKSEILGATLIGPQKPFYVPTAALVTNLSAHFKWGRESSLVWVTTLDKAEPVQNASVAIRDCAGKAVWQGATNAQGIALIPKELPSHDKLPTCKVKWDEDASYDSTQTRAISQMDSGLFVIARTADDMTFVHSSWDEGIEPFRFRLPNDDYTAPVIAHTIFDRTLLRAGETVHMKHVLRRQKLAGIGLVARNLPDMVRIQHLAREDTYEFPLQWDLKKGVSETSWPIPKEAKLGHYAVSLVKKEEKQGVQKKLDTPEIAYPSGEFRVEEFRVPLMRASIKPLSEPLVNASEISIDLFVEYLSGGGATNLPVKLRSQIKPRLTNFDDYDTYTIANGAVKEGITRRSRSEEMEPEDEGDDRSPGSRRDSTQEKGLATLDLQLGAGGMVRTTIKSIPAAQMPRELLTELEFKDPNGEIQTVSKKTPIWPSRVLTGIDAEDVGRGNLIKAKLIALDLSGKPLMGVTIKADLFKQSYYSHRKRLVGGFYAYEHVEEIKRIGPACEGITDKDGLVWCEIKSPVSGSVIIQAQGEDPSGNISMTHSTVWVRGKGETWFDQGSSDRIDLIPEKKSYEPGETASFQVRMPMREATVLITVERSGVLDARVVKLSGKNPVVTLPIKESYAPNVFISALCVRGRTAGAKATALVDLGRPSYKLGITGISVGWAGHELKVQVTPDKKVYKVRDKAMVRIKVTSAGNKPLPSNGEVAVAAVDEGLLELMPNKSWGLLEKMMQKRGYSILTSTAQMQVVGKRHYGLKALPLGGGGGRQLTRELFDTLLLWKARLPLDKNGEASIEVPLSDALTSFAIVAVATCGEDLFGTGRARIQTSQDLILTSGLPVMVRYGDRFKAGFLIRNTTQRPLDIGISATVDNGKGKKNLPALKEQIEAGEAKEIAWDMNVPIEGDTLKWEVVARERGGDTGDALKVAQKISPYAPVQVVQSTLARLEGRLDMSIEQPKGAVPGKGGIKVSLKPKLSENIAGITDYMGQYPFTCLEQQVSKAIALNDRTMWTGITSRIPSHLDKDGLAKYFPGQVSGSDTLTAYILAIAHEAQWEIPSGIASRMEGGLRSFIEGKLHRYQPLPTADLTIRKITAIEALSRRGKAEQKLLDSISREPNLWPTSAVIDWTRILTGMKTFPDREKRLKEAEQIIRSRLNFQGTTMGFSTEKTDNLWWLMTGSDVNSVRTLLTFMNDPSWREEIPRIARGALGRQKKGRWDTTVANAWGRLALKKFGNAFEKETVSGTSTGELGKEKQSLNWATLPGGGTLSFGWPKGEKTLSLVHIGTGKPWATVQSMAAVPRKIPFSSGYRIKKSITPVIQKSSGTWTVGDVMRIRIEAEAQSDMTWVVVTDPIPAGAAILGSGLGRDSTILTGGEKAEGRVWPVHEERTFEAFRAYYEYVPKGTWRIEYTVQLNNRGVFLVPATRIEALYAPEMFGESPNDLVEIK
ncbi:MAG: alpha-2-macroglobulin [Syntrophus sp. (in: bacteria)]|nr:alpha-2-macroglobulin [Syntrophus sp. (in: bacteria)]